MRFYVPEWDDAVDAHYDFEHDELSTLNRQERNLAYIWDIFDRETTPIDGVLISREQVEETNRKAARLAEYGVYDDPVLSVPDWLPTISDCGAWGYKSLPFPPYDNAEMLDFYDTLNVTVGVTIDHLVLGSGKDKGRLYLDKRAFHDDFTKQDIPDALGDVVDLMVDEWPNEWPTYVDEYEPTIRTGANAEVQPFSPELFKGDVDTVLARLAEDTRSVYRKDDKRFRYELTLRNAREMYRLYEAGEYPFRLMVAIQGWDSESYVEAAEAVLELGYDYLGIGGVAGSPVHDVRIIVKEVGKTVKTHEREHNTRVDSHVFGFAKTEAFETIGRTGMTSFDSASMLRSAWTGGDNYRLDTTERYDAIRVRYPSSTDTLEEAIETSLRGRETLVALRAYAAEESIPQALTEWHNDTQSVLAATRAYLRDHRHDERYNAARLLEIESAFRDDFEQARALQASFSAKLRGKLVKLLRQDDPTEPVAFEEYDDLLTLAERQFERFPRMVPRLEQLGEWAGGITPFEQILTVVRDYATWIGDDDLLDAYRRTLAHRPWEKCDCPLCTNHGIEICIFRGNDRNRRRGFHNTRCFYDEFATELPKILVAIQGTAALSNYETVEDYLKDDHPAFWQHVHELPVAEVGIVDASGIREWWRETPASVSFAPGKMAENLGQQTERYHHLFLHTPNDRVDTEVLKTVEAGGCQVQTFEQASDLRDHVLETLGENYAVGDDFLPHTPQIPVESELSVLVIDQCSGLKQFPESAPVFEQTNLDQATKEELLDRKNVPGIAARDLYIGRQQELITDAVRQLRAAGHSVERYFVSAGFGLVAAEEQLPPYDATFSSMKVQEIRERSSRLRVQEDLERVLTESEYDVVFFTLGKDYYTSIDIDRMVQKVRADRIGVVFNRELVEDQFENIVSVPARLEDAKKFGTIVIGLKGQYVKNFAQHLNRVNVIEPRTIKELCRVREEDLTQLPFETF